MKNNLSQIYSRMLAATLSLAILGSSAFSPVGADSGKFKETVRQHPLSISSAIMVGSAFLSISAGLTITSVADEYAISTLNSSEIECDVKSAKKQLTWACITLNSKFKHSNGTCLCNIKDDVINKTDPRVLLKVVQTINFVLEKVPVIRDVLMAKLLENNGSFILTTNGGLEGICSCDMVTNVTQNVTQDVSFKLGPITESLHRTKEHMVEHFSEKNVGKYISKEVIRALGEMFAEELIKAGAELDQTGVDTYLRSVPAYSAYVGGQQYQDDLRPYLVSSLGRPVVLFANILRDYCNGVDNPIIKVAFKSYLDDLENDIWRNVGQFTMLKLNDRV